jgi:hypothetical protein
VPKRMSEPGSGVMLGDPLPVSRLSVVRLNVQVEHLMPTKAT